MTSNLVDITIPVTFLDVANGANFTSWTILVDGQSARIGVPKWDGETLSFFDGATFFMLR